MMEYLVIIGCLVLDFFHRHRYSVCFARFVCAPGAGSRSSLGRGSCPAARLCHLVSMRQDTHGFHL